MPDMLVKLYELPDINPVMAEMRVAGFDIRRGMAPEKHVALAWVREHFSNNWASETDVAYNNRPLSCFVATRETDNPYEPQMLGFACYDSVLKGFFGPTGVDETYRGRGIGKALLLVCLYDMRAQGYGYAIIGAAGPTDFYAKAVGAVEIPDSWPGIYRGMLREKKTS